MALMNYNTSDPVTTQMATEKKSGYMQNNPNFVPETNKTMTTAGTTIYMGNDGVFRFAPLSKPNLKTKIESTAPSGDFRKMTGIGENAYIGVMKDNPNKNQNDMSYKGNIYQDANQNTYQFNEPNPGSVLSPSVIADLQKNNVLSENWYEHYLGTGGNNKLYKSQTITHNMEPINADVLKQMEEYDKANGTDYAKYKDNPEIWYLRNAKVPTKATASINTGGLINYK